MLFRYKSNAPQLKEKKIDPPPFFLCIVSVHCMFCLQISIFVDLFTVWYNTIFTFIIL